MKFDSFREFVHVIQGKQRLLQKLHLLPVRISVPNNLDRPKFLSRIVADVMLDSEESISREVIPEYRNRDEYPPDRKSISLLFDPTLPHLLKMRDKLDQLQHDVTAGCPEGCPLDAGWQQADIAPFIYCSECGAIIHPDPGQIYSAWDEDSRQERLQRALSAQSI